jgi:hypothetical protein
MKQGLSQTKEDGMAEVREQAISSIIIVWQQIGSG